MFQLTGLTISLYSMPRNIQLKGKSKLENVGKKLRAYGEKDQCIKKLARLFFTH